MAVYPAKSDGKTVKPAVRTPTARQAGGRSKSGDRVNEKDDGVSSSKAVAAQPQPQTKSRPVVAPSSKSSATKGGTAPITVSTTPSALNDRASRKHRKPVISQNEVEVGVEDARDSCGDISKIVVDGNGGIADASRELPAGGAREVRLLDLNIKFAKPKEGESTRA